MLGEEHLTEEQQAAEEPTLTEALFAKGFTHKQKPGSHGRHNIRPAAHPGRVVFTGDAAECWAWLNSGCPVAEPDPIGEGPTDDEVGKQAGPSIGEVLETSNGSE